jgi:hypothetical protein
MICLTALSVALAMSVHSPIVGRVMKKYARKRSWPFSGYYSGIHLEELSKKPCQDSPCPSRVSNLVSPEDKTGALPRKSFFSVEQT